MQNYELIGEGKTTKVYRDGGKAMKLYLSAPPDKVIIEAQKQEFARKAGLPVPEVFGVSETAGGIALEMAFISGETLIKQKMDRLERNAAVEKLVELQCMVHQVTADSLPKQSDMLARKIERAEQLDQAVTARLLKSLHMMDYEKNRLCHGDFHALNVLKDGDAYWIIDWVDASSGDPLADACRSYMIFRQYISRMAEVYLRFFCAKAGVKRDEVLAWLPIVAAARLTENLDEKECAAILDIIKAAM